MQITCTHVDSDGLTSKGMHASQKALSREVWNFVVILDAWHDGVLHLKLSSYRIERRDSTRHKWRYDSKEAYHFADPRNGRMKREKVSIPDSIAVAAKRQLADRVLVERG